MQIKLKHIRSCKHVTLYEIFIKQRTKQKLSCKTYGKQLN